MSIATAAVFPAHPSESYRPTADQVYDASDPTRATGTSRLSDITQMQAVLRWPGLPPLAETIDEILAPEPGVVRRGRRPTHPTALLLAVVIGARITGSMASILALLRDRDVWNYKLAPVWNENKDFERMGFSAVSPNRNQMRHFIERLLERPEVQTDQEETSQSPALAGLQGMFRRVAVSQSKRMGNLDPTRPIDWASPSLCNAVFGDGVVVTPFSDVRAFEDPVTGERIFEGSRALHAPRLAPVITDLRPDKKDHKRGLNMVSLSTPTDWGWVVLGTGVALRAEQWAALDLLDQIAPLASGGIFTLLWDKVFNGWLVDYAVAKHRVRVVNKVVSAKSNETALEEDMDGATAQRRLANQHLARLNSETVPDWREADYDVPEHHRGLVRAHWRQIDLHDMWRQGKPVPLGVGLYRATSASSVTGSRNITDRGKVTNEATMFRWFGKHTHDPPNGACNHEMYVDGGSLHTVEYDVDLACLVKTATAKCVASDARRRANGAWGTTDVWRMPCPHGDFEITTRWDPQNKRFTPDTPAEVVKTPENMLLTDLRPISRNHAQEFANIANFRNNAESFNNWYKSRLPRHGRAASLSQEGQELDYLAGACLLNALTWAAFDVED